MDPVTIAVVAGAGISAYSSYQQGVSQQNMANYNARIASQNAALTVEQMDISQREKGITQARQRRETEKVLSSQRAKFAKAGVEMAGTPLMVAADTMYESDLDSLAIQYSSTVEQGQLLAKEAGLRQEASLQKMSGKAARDAGYLGAGSSLLSGIGTAAYYKKTS